MYANRMKTLQIRNVPDDVHRRLKARAAMEGRSLSDLALAELTRSLERPTRRELLDRIAAREPVEIPGGAAAVIRAERDSR
jgi:plasmid stability protein